MWVIVTLPFLFQGLLMAFDEWRYHIRRSLPLWERIGHPMDTISFLACILFVLFVPFDISSIKWYVMLSLFSCLLVTKDEFVHHDVCPKEEQWIHALLFTLHPIMLTLLGFIWPAIYGEGVFLTLFDNPEALEIFVILLSGFVSLFFLYQVIAWNILWRRL